MVLSFGGLQFRPTDLEFQQGAELTKGQEDSAPQGDADVHSRGDTKGVM